jgi:hypothetical protein
MKKSLPKAQFGSLVKAVGKGFKTVGTAYKEEKALKAANKLAEAQRAKRAEAAARAAETRKANAAARKAEADKAAKAQARKTKKPADAGKQLNLFDDKGEPKAKTTTTKPVAPKPKVESKKPKADTSNKKAADKKGTGNLKAAAIGIGTAAAVTGITYGALKKSEQAKAIKESKPDWTKPTTPAPSTNANTNSVAKKVLKSAGRYKFSKGGFKKR